MLTWMQDKAPVIKWGHRVAVPAAHTGAGSTGRRPLAANASPWGCGQGQWGMKGGVPPASRQPASLDRESQPTSYLRYQISPDIYTVLPESQFTKNKNI